MYENLVKAMRSKGLSVLALSKIIGMPEPTLRGKLTEGRIFSVEEAIRTKMLAFPEYDIAYLFAPEEKEEE